MTGEAIRIIRERLKHGVAEVSSPFDRRAKPVYLLVLVMVVATALLIVAFGFEVKMEVWRKLPFAAAPLAVCGMTLRRYGHPDAGGTVEATALVYIQGIATVLILFPITRMSLPFGDGYIAKADALLGFHWPTVAALLTSDDRVYRMAVFAYESFAWQTLVIIPALFFTRKSVRAWRFVAATALAAIATIIIYPFIPAHGPAVQYGLVSNDFPLLGQFPWQFGADLQKIKNGYQVISLNMIFGMVSVPSYHAASALMFMWAAWGSKYLRWPFFFLNSTMIPATLVVGVHYLTDVVAGLIVGGLAIFFASRMVYDEAAAS